MLDLQLQEEEWLYLKETLQLEEGEEEVEELSEELEDDRHSEAHLRCVR